MCGSDSVLEMALHSYWDDVKVYGGLASDGNHKFLRFDHVTKGNRACAMFSRGLCDDPAHLLIAKNNGVKRADRHR